MTCCPTSTSTPAAKSPLTENTGVKTHTETIEAIKSKVNTSETFPGHESYIKCLDNYIFTISDLL